MSREKIREWGGAGFQETKHRECKDTMQNAHTLISRPILILLPLTTKLLTVVQGEGSLKSTVSLLLGLERVREDGVTDTLQGRGRRQVREQPATPAALTFRECTLNNRHVSSKLKVKEH